jgi:ketosteroid isomerase-like protein
LESPSQALGHFYRALNNRDIEQMEQNWSQSQSIVMDNPLGSVKKGWNEIRSVYVRLFQADAKNWFQFYDFTIQQSGTLFCAIGRERGQFETSGVKLDLAIRTTRLFEKSDGRWRQIHHHGSIDDPAMLRAYHEAVFGRSGDPAEHPKQAASNREKLLGTWNLVSWEIDDGHIIQPLGDRPVGQLSYSADGRMSAQLMRRHQRLFANADWRKAASDEKATAWSGYFGYFGSYSIDEEQQAVVHKIDGSWFPNLVGTEQKRSFRFQGNNLLLTADTEWGHVRIVWERTP